MTAEEKEAVNELYNSENKTVLCCYTDYNKKGIYPKCYRLNSIAIIGSDCQTILSEMCDKRLIFKTSKEMIDYVIEELKGYGYNVLFTKEGGYIFPLILWYERSYPELLHKFIYN